MTNKTTVMLGVTIFVITTAVSEYCMRRELKKSEKYWKEEEERLDQPAHK